MELLLNQKSDINTSSIRRIINMKNESNQYNINENDKLTIKNALLSITNGPYIDDNEFKGLIQMNREQVKKLEQKWPDIKSNDLSSWRTVKLCLLNLLAYPHGKEEMLYKDLNINEEQLEQLLNKVKLIVRDISLQEK